MFNNLKLSLEKKNEEFSTASQLKTIDKVTILQEARMFHDSRLSTRKCTVVLSKLLHLLNQGEQLTAKEATDVFFAITRLIQCKDNILRYIVYICIKELSKTANDIIIMTSSIIQDITSKNGTFRSQAIRALWKITDVSMLPSVERYMKQAIVDQSSIIASSALVSSLQLATTGSMDIVKRWSNEILQALGHDTAITQYHALAALFTIRHGDRIALIKLINNFIKSNSRSSYAHVLTIKTIREILTDEILTAYDKKIWDDTLFSYLEECLHHHQEMVTIEASSCISNLPKVPKHKVSQTVSALQLLLSSQKSICRFSAVRILSKLADNHSESVAACNLDLEYFLRGTNRNICILAITTLLKTSDESSVDRLMQQITNFMSEISDDHRTAVVDAIRILSKKYPQKHHSLIKFLATMLREDGGVEFKDAVVNALSISMKSSPSARAYGLAKLCEFIEDCEHENLTTKILYLLGSEAMKTGLTSQHIRYIYNRIVLESPTIRSAAITALARIAASEPKCRKRVLALLKHSVRDPDDAVRDRAAFYFEVLNEIEYNDQLTDEEINDLLKYITSCHVYTSKPEQKKPKAAEGSTDNTKDYFAQSVDTAAFDATDALASKEFTYKRILDQIHSATEISNLGTFLKTNDPVALTEAEVEYNVRCIKHLFTNYMILEYKIENTLDDVQLNKVYIDLKIDEGNFEVVEVIPAESIRRHETQSVFCCLKLSNDLNELIGTLNSTLKFHIKDVDPNTGETDDLEPGYADQLNLEDIDIVIGDYIIEDKKSQFDDAFKNIGTDALEVIDSFMLPYSSIPDAVDAVTKLFGVQSNDEDFQKQTRKSPVKYELQFVGRFRDDIGLMIKARFVLASANQGNPMSVHMHLVVRSFSDELNKLIIHSIC
ncbi:hypothetical protein GJ496_009020 [Pomphorhynchus laevis]|nr:hypothetical protein GJ496_009020 [Pomphorhynchus laevis]